MTARMMTTLRKLLAVGIAVVAAALIFALTIAPVTDTIAELDASILEQRETLGHFLAAARTDIETHPSLGRDQSANTPATTLQGNSDAIKTANLQALIKDLTGTEGAKFRSSRSVPPKLDGPVRLLGVSAEFSADASELQNILAAIENARPYLFVEGLHISARTTAARSSEPGEKILDVRFEVFGAVANKTKS